MKVLVCGSRDYGFKLEERDKVFGKLEELLDKYKNLYTYEYEDLTLILGGAKGVDTAAGHWAVLCSIPIELYKADWNTWGKSAGPIRNIRMLAEGKPDLVIAFLAPDSKGTKHMIDIATKADIPVEIINV